MRTFAELLNEGLKADVGGWGFGWLDGRATEERPPWGYARLLAERLKRAGSALDLDTGGGEIIGEMPVLPPRMAVTEGWPPNAERARQLLEPRGAEIAEAGPGARLPFEDDTFELVSSRHPVRPDFAEIARVLKPGGTYFAQHVGPGSAFELIEWFLGPQSRAGRDPEREADQARAAGLDVVDLRTARCRMEFHDVGAVVWILRKCVWWVPDFGVDRYREPLLRMDAHLREHGVFTAHSTRTLIEATYRGGHVDACDRGHGAGRGGGPRQALPGR
ncbi:methyltransferase domain-containing protein [Actinoplanes sp. NPDC026670]|uniref:class I SAM-dependent methyltransferase n=1 Tax=Actinoplanes sp. NPDC026670 TaxID=3154700 RepID=UPI0033DF2A70